MLKYKSWKMVQDCSENKMHTKRVSPTTAPNQWQVSIIHWRLG